MTTIDSLHIDDLTAQCADETAKYRQQRPSDVQYCFELMRRALARGVEEALSALFTVFLPVAERWVRRQPDFERAGESAEYFASGALARFIRYASGDGFDRFPRYENLLAYLKMCTFTSVSQHFRDHGGGERDLPDDDFLADDIDLDSPLEVALIWQRVCTVLPDASDQKLARWSFILAMPPADIFAHDPNTWGDIDAIYTARQRIRRALQRDPILRGWAGLD